MRLIAVFYRGGAGLRKKKKNYYNFYLNCSHNKPVFLKLHIQVHCRCQFAFKYFQNHIIRRILGLTPKDLVHNFDWNKVSNKSILFQFYSGNGALK